MRQTTLASLVLMSLSRSAIAQSPLACSQAEAKAAEESVGGLKTWNALQESFQRFGKCDDAAIAEAYSDLVMRLLADHWQRVTDLAKLGASDPQFKSFVLRHIDETWINCKFTLVIANAKNRCPDGARSICTEIVDRGEKVESVMGQSQ